MRRADYNSMIQMTPLTTVRHPSISEELDNMPQTIEAATHGHLGTEPGNHRQVSTIKQERVGSRLLAMTGCFVSGYFPREAAVSQLLK